MKTICLTASPGSCRKCRAGSWRFRGRRTPMRSRNFLVYAAGAAGRHAGDHGPAGAHIAIDVHDAVDRHDGHDADRVAHERHGADPQIQKQEEGTGEKVPAVHCRLPERADAGPRAADQGDERAESGAGRLPGAHSAARPPAVGTDAVVSGFSVPAPRRRQRAGGAADPIHEAGDYSGERSASDGAAAVGAGV